MSDRDPFATCINDLNEPTVLVMGEPPALGSVLAAGYDLVSTHPHFVLARGERQLVKTGVWLEMPDNMAAFVVPRSGLALKKGITITNAPGLIDPDYRGEIGVILQNMGEFAVTISEGERIAQLVFVPIVRPKLIKIDKLGSTERGGGGFGSTGS